MRNLTFALILLISLFFVSSCSKSISDAAMPSSGYVGPVTSASGGNTGNPRDSSGLMTAGEWNDIDHWEFWNSVLQRDTIKTFADQWGFYTTNKVTIVIKDADDRLVHDVKLSLSDAGTTFSGVTDNSGRANIIAGLHTPGYNNQTFGLRATYLNKVYDLGTFTATNEPIEKKLPVLKQPASTLDIQFVVDATGSMGDEISYLKNELKDVVRRAGSQLPGVQIRVGSVFYRDVVDDYLTRPFDFTTNPALLVNFIAEQNAEGGGDFPEAVDEALDEAVNHQEWSIHAVNRLMFLILDAPPHNTYSVMTKLKKAVEAAQQRGIRIIPVTASGIDKETEFLMRFLSVSTNSTYTFITNDSGIGGDHLKPTIGDYQVEYLNNLMVRLITKYGTDKN